MKKTACICFSLMLSFIMCLPASAERESVSTEVIDMGDSVKVEAENLKTGEKMFVPLSNCKKTILTVVNEDGSIDRSETLEGYIDFSEDSAPGLSSRASMEYDSSAGVKATVKVEYSKGYEACGDDYFENCTVKYVSGQWEVEDSSVSIQNKAYIYFCEGMHVEGDQYSGWIELDDDVYSFWTETGFDEAVSPFDPAGIAGAAMSADLKRADDEWSLRIDALVVNNLPVYF